MPFARAMSARSWLQASNPSERWKWDFMYQDLPPVKGHNVQMEGATAPHRASVRDGDPAMPHGAIPLTPVQGPPHGGPDR
jgi:hypothetical protein